MTNQQGQDVSDENMTYAQARRELGMSWGFALFVSGVIGFSFLASLDDFGQPLWFRTAIGVIPLIQAGVGAVLLLWGITAREERP